jgi:predicted transcriptional regulator
MTDVKSYIEANPECTCLQIAKALGVSTGAVRLELYELRRLGVIESKGNTRGTRYTVAVKP